MNNSLPNPYGLGDTCNPPHSAAGMINGFGPGFQTGPMNTNPRPFYAPQTTIAGIQNPDTTSSITLLNKFCAIRDMVISNPDEPKIKEHLEECRNAIKGYCAMRHVTGDPDITEAVNKIEDSIKAWRLWHIHNALTEEFKKGDPSIAEITIKNTEGISDTIAELLQRLTGVKTSIKKK